MKIILLTLIILLTSSCGNQVIRPDRHEYSGLNQARSNYQQQNYRSAASEYEQLYRQYGNDDFAIYAADSYLQQGNSQKAEALLLDIHPNNNPIYQLIQAQLNINKGNYNFNLQEVNGNYRPRYLRVQAQLALKQQRPVDAALALIELSTYEASEELTQTIINVLNSIPENQVSTALFNSNLSELQQGWFEAIYAAQSQNSETIASWKNNWNVHPANALFLQSKAYGNVAVLLPITGKYKNISKSIQQGMIASLYRDGAEDMPQLTFFDTGSNGESFSYAWYGAIESGADFIIGPLEKNSINQLSNLNSSTLPVLLLNEVEEDTNSLGFYQFALSQQDEVRNVADRLIAENKKRIMVLAPETTKGQMLAQKFEQDLSYNGGEVVSYAFYPPSTHDYSTEIKQALGLNDANYRAKKLERLIKTKLKYETQVRPDIDAIFIIAKPKQARLIKPQLKFFKAEDVPVYSTSQILASSLNPDLDKDLNGIKFCQSAFVIDPNSLQGVVNFNTNNLKVNNKFFAFGYDALALYSRLEWMQRMPNQKIEGMSGYLNIDGNNKVHRELAWAQFKNGKPVLIPSIAPIEDELNNSNEMINE